MTITKKISILKSKFLDKYIMTQEYQNWMEDYFEWRLAHAKLVTKAHIAIVKITDFDNKLKMLLQVKQNMNWL